MTHMAQRSVRGSMRRWMPTLVSSVLVFCLLCSAAEALPVCSIISGVTHDHFSFALSTYSALGAERALVLSAAGSFSDSEKLSINATYLVPPGVAVTRVEENVLTIPYVMSGTEVLVDVRSTSGKIVPFTFLSFLANTPECFIPIGEYHPFRGLLPSAVNEFTSKEYDPSHVYFVVTAPSFANSVVISILGSPTPAESIFVISQEPTPTFNIYASGDSIPISGTLFFAYTPSTEKEPHRIVNYDVEISLAFSARKGRASPRTTSLPHAGIKGKAIHDSFTMLKVIVIVFFVWFFSTGYYNFTTGERREFPYMFPFGDAIAQILTRTGFLNRRGYQDIDNTRI